MDYYKTEGLVEGYIVPSTKAVFTMNFIIEDQIALQLNITHQATVSESCGLKDKVISQWLWENGNEFLLSNSLNYGTSITLGANDISEGSIVTAFENLRKEEIKHAQ